MTEDQIRAYLQKNLRVQMEVAQVECKGKTGPDGEYGTEPVLKVSVLLGEEEIDSSYVYPWELK